MERINRMAENLGIDEVMWAAGREHLKKTGQFPPTSRAKPRVSIGIEL
jgi:hypothetical protein